MSAERVRNIINCEPEALDEEKRRKATKVVAANCLDWDWWTRTSSGSPPGSIRGRRDGRRSRG